MLFLNWLNVFLCHNQWGIRCYKFVSTVNPARNFIFLIIKYSIYFWNNTIPPINGKQRCKIYFIYKFSSSNYGRAEPTRGFVVFKRTIPADRDLFRRQVSVFFLPICIERLLFASSPLWGLVPSDLRRLTGRLLSWGKSWSLSFLLTSGIGFGSRRVAFRRKPFRTLLLCCWKVRAATFNRILSVLSSSPDIIRRSFVRKFRNVCRRKALLVKYKGARRDERRRFVELKLLSISGNSMIVSRLEIVLQSRTLTEMVLLKDGRRVNKVIDGTIHIGHYALWRVAVIPNYVFDNCQFLWHLIKKWYKNGITWILILEEFCRHEMNGLNC